MKTPAALVAGIVSAVGATACCFGPLLLVTLGFGGAWAARLKALEAIQPVFVVLTAGFMVLAFHRLYIRPKRCVVAEDCDTVPVLRRQRIAFWIVASAILFMATFPLFAPYFY